LALPALRSEHAVGIRTRNVRRDDRSGMSEACRLHPDVIVTDISMPILSGIEAVHKLRELGSTAKFVFVTVHSAEEFVEACMKAGALGYVRKFWLKVHLVLAIKAVLAGQPYVRN
jgi:DNA-binding NarL/FixJ family response regulator